MTELPPSSPSLWRSALKIVAELRVWELSFVAPLVSQTTPRPCLWVSQLRVTQSHPQGCGQRPRSWTLLRPTGPTEILPLELWQEHCMDECFQTSIIKPPLFRGSGTLARGGAAETLGPGLESQQPPPSSGTAGLSLLSCGDDWQLADEDFDKAIAKGFLKLSDHKIHLIHELWNVLQKTVFLKSTFGKHENNKQVWNIKWFFNGILIFFTRHLKMIDIQRWIVSKKDKDFLIQSSVLAF